MLGAEMEAHLRAARLEVDRGIELLMSPSPQALDECSRLLDSVGRQLAAFQVHLGPGGRTPNALEAGRRLQVSVSRASRLLEGAANFHFNWGRMRDTLCAGYTGSGVPAPAPSRSRISIQG